MSDPILEAKNLAKSYIDHKNEVKIFDALNFTLAPKDRVAIVGASGSGKSTLLHVLSGLDQPTSGEVWLNGHCLSQGSEKARGVWRNRYLGFIYQFHHLLPEFTAVDNVAIPCIIGGMSVKEATERAQAMLNRVGLSHRLSHKPSALSGGERQRVAIARALVTEPLAVLADEPTGNLDSDNAHAVFDLMCEINQEIGTALVVVTHDLTLAHKMDHRFRLANHQLIQEQ
ncbi:lipoprotein-releasing ABC transporter ATP-binding protein LolD [Wohlfahrtiimonas chitiniclastica]|uniref:lipoprotein-releasing ABC transporter ATP-binding protein LolD n=1 Tax=Wohlfahrtiimonas chitiniclastica TaxID=400946 RepID=UPI00038013F2|nr:lipoprotein-releasing ABC transporter ATP-binding protein LolD [Wohlfahrtiimonas chitiniclastica]